MEIIRCEKGHFYDADVSKTCPTCAREAGGVQPSMADTLTTDFFRDGSMDEIGKTVAAFGGESMVTAPTAPMTPAAPTAPATPVVSMGGGMVEAYSPTQAAGYFGGSATPAGNSFGMDAITPTSPVTPFDPDMNNGPSSKGVFNPVVGWLVCVEGESKGADYRIRSQYNYIGRARHMDICIPSDPFISAERAATLAFDNQENMFFFGPGTGHNLVRVNGTPIMNAVQLKAYDELTIGKTKLLFIPLCGENFDWNKK